MSSVVIDILILNNSVKKNPPTLYDRINISVFVNFHIKVTGYMYNVCVSIWFSLTVKLYKGIWKVYNYFVGGYLYLHLLIYIRKYICLCITFLAFAISILDLFNFLVVKNTSGFP